MKKLVTKLLAQLKTLYFARKRLCIGIFIAFVSLIFVFRACTLGDHEIPLFKIGQDVEWPGLNLLSKERNLSAFNSDLFNAISKVEGMEIHMTLIPYSALLKKLDNLEVDGVILTLQPNVVNEQYYLYSDPFFLTGPVLVISSGEPVSGWNEMSRKIIGVPANSPIFRDLEKDPSVQIKIYDAILPALADLHENRIDGVIFPAIPSYAYTHSFYEGKLKIITPPLTKDGMRLVVLKDDIGKELIEKFNAGLKKLKENGTFDELLSRWGLVNIEKAVEK